MKKNYQIFQRQKNKPTFSHRLKTNNVNVKILADNEEFIPKYQTEGAACADLVCNLDVEYLIINSQDIFLIDCGFSLELPFGYEAQIRPRSGMSLQGFSVVNSPGVIDSDYRGRIKVAIKNTTDKNQKIMNKQRIAQISIHPVTRFNWVPSQDISSSSRGEGGFGSTGQ